MCRWLKVSVLIGYLVVGALIGQGGLGWVFDDDHELAHFAEVGVFLLLFSIGLEFSLDDLKRLGKNFVIGGATQMLLVAIPVAIALLMSGKSWQPAILIASAVAFSSTVLVFRTLTEFGQTQQPHGRRAIGILLFQDAALVPLLLMVPLLTGVGEVNQPAALYSLALTSLGFLIAVIGLRHVLAEWVIPMFASFRSSELIVLFVLVALGGVTMAAYSIGLPPAVGAFAAGLIFNGNRWSHQVDALVLPFRESFAAVFFVGLGLILDPILLWHEPAILFVMLPMLLVLKAIAAGVALKLTGLSLRSAMGMGIGLAHVGEFAFVLVLKGVEGGVLESVDYQRVVSVAVASLILTPSLMKFGLRFLDTVQDEPRKQPVQGLRQVRRSVVIGAGPVGRSLTSQLETFGYDVCLIDLSPINLHEFAQTGFHTVAGDATDDTVLLRAHADQASLILVCVPEDAVAVRIVRRARELNRAARVIVRCRYNHTRSKLMKVGANDVVAEENESAISLMRLVEEETTS